MDVKGILKYIREYDDFIKYNEEIFKILEGNLLSKLNRTIDEQLSHRSAQIMKSRAIPINVLKKIISKLSKLYYEAPTRLTENPVNQDLIDWYTQTADINIIMGNCNESFNAYKNTSIEIMENEEARNLVVRCIPSHQFLVMSDSLYTPLEPTMYIKFMGSCDGDNKYWLYTDEGFKSISSNGESNPEDLRGNAGVNPYGIIPFSYLTRSSYSLIPEIDTDTLRMATMVPLQLTEISFASMFLANPVIYGVDLDVENLNMSPAQFWNFKSDAEGKAPSIGVIKPELDMQQQVEYAKELLNMWLESRNIKAGGLGNLNSDNAASGIALAIREMDTTQDRVDQEKHFKNLEQDFWRRLGIIHNKLAAVGRLENKQQFSNPETMEVAVEYTDQKPINDENTDINNTIALLNSGLISKKMAIKRLNPDLGSDEVDKLILEIEEENIIELPEIEADIEAPIVD